MDMLRKEMERKKRALAAAAAAQQTGGGGEDGANTKRRRYLKTSELRRCQEEKEEEMRKDDKHERQQQQQQQLKHKQKGNESNINKKSSSIIEQRQEEENRKKDGNDSTHKLDEKTKGKTKAIIKKGKGSSGIGEKDNKDSDNNNSVKDENETDDLFRFVSRMSSTDITNRFRSMGLPVRLFGEYCRSNNDTATAAITTTTKINDDSDAVRRKRLLKALRAYDQAMLKTNEMEDFKLGQGHSIRNPFLKQFNKGGDQEEEEEDDDDDDNHKSIGKQSEDVKSGKSSNRAGGDNNKTKKKGGYHQQHGEAEDGNDLGAAAAAANESDDPQRRIYVYFKGLLKEWEQDLLQRDDDVKKSLAGRNETKTHKQCKDYIRPLFKLCKTRQLEENLTNQLAKIVDFCLQGEFVKAHDAYLDVAIGRAAWPIGVTMVGIHARKGRAKIESQNVAHVMNSELQRKYLTSVKRLMSYAQKKATHVDPSKKVLS